MALRQALSPLGVSRLLRWGGASNEVFSQGPLGFAAAGSTDDANSKGSEMQQSSHARSMLNTLSMAQMPTLMGVRKEEQQPVSSKPLAAAATMLAGAMRGMPLLPARSAALPSMRMGPMQAQQSRAYNAWSPAQRYFVEGQHVIDAEANRTLQFTGLDSGSFYPFLVWTAFATVVAGVFMIVPWVVAPARVDLEKSSAYECGFDAFGEARSTFSVSFYLVSIMYLLFDIEIAYLFPYVMTHASTPMFWTMNLFLSILVAGFVYEWGVGALEWRESQAH